MNMSYLFHAWAHRCVHLCPRASSPCWQSRLAEAGWAGCLPRRPPGTQPPARAAFPALEEKPTNAAYFCRLFWLERVAGIIENSTQTVVCAVALVVSRQLL